MPTFYCCDHDEGPCVISERAMQRTKADPARCVAHGAIIGSFIRGPGGQEPQDREEARKFLGVPFKKLYSRSHGK
jgi:hypothetical protein